MKETAALAGNRGTISALAFSPDGSKLSAGDVSRLNRSTLLYADTSTVEWDDYPVRCQRTEGEVLASTANIYINDERQPTRQSRIAGLTTVVV